MKIAGLAALLAIGGVAQVDAAEGEAAVRRIGADQYRNIIHDVFGASIELGGYFSPELRINGLGAVGAAKITVAASDMEQYDAMARIIAGQVTDEKHRGQMIPCRPAAPNAPDDACASRFLAKVGRLLYRRPLTALELGAHVAAAHAAAATMGDFYQGVSLSLAALLSSPQFLFREAIAEPDPAGGARLNAYSKASQLSFFLWNAGPDLPLLDAAARGELATAKGLVRQVERMMASPRLEAGMRAFFTDNFGFEGGAVTKDTVLFPKFSASVAASAEEQTLKTIVDLLLTQKGDYRDIFTTKKTYLTQELAAIYQVPLAGEAPNGAPDTWQPFEFEANDPRAGILTQVAFTAFHSPAGRGSPTLRGKALREIILCQTVPAPPGDVKFNLINDTSNPLYKTARKRLTAHRSNPVCGGCHKIVDPIGLALEDFDGGGEYRTRENGEAIDTSGELDGVAFSDAAGLAKAVHDNPAAPACAVNRLASYALGRAPSASDKPWVTMLETGFAASGYRFIDLMRTIALSDALYRVTPPKAASAAGG
ncbi:MAG: DUF1592 domain-containing protein [Rhodospirillaceae bacterium]